jgi:hypothetical protein
LCRQIDLGLRRGRQAKQCRDERPEHILFQANPNTAFFGGIVVGRGKLNFISYITI